VGEVGTVHVKVPKEPVEEELEMIPVEEDEAIPEEEEPAITEEDPGREPEEVGSAPLLEETSSTELLLAPSSALVLESEHAKSKQDTMARKKNFGERKWLFISEI